LLKLQDIEINLTLGPDAPGSGYQLYVKDRINQMVFKSWCLE